MVARDMSKYSACSRVVKDGRRLEVWNKSWCGSMGQAGENGAEILSANICSR